MSQLFNDMENIFTDVFGAPVELVPEDEDPIPVTGIFVETWNPEEAGVFKDYGGKVSTLDIRKVDLPDCFAGKGHVHVNGKRYRCVDDRPDEREMVKLVLQSAGLAPAPVGDTP